MKPLVESEVVSCEKVKGKKTFICPPVGKSLVLVQCFWGCEDDFEAGPGFRA